MEGLREIVEDTLLPKHFEAMADEVGVEIARTVRTTARAWLLKTRASALLAASSIHVSYSDLFFEQCFLVLTQNASLTATFDGLLLP